MNQDSPGRPDTSGGARTARVAGAPRMGAADDSGLPTGREQAGRQALRRPPHPPRHRTVPGDWKGTIA